MIKLIVILLTFQSFQLKTCIRELDGVDCTKIYDSTCIDGNCYTTCKKTNKCTLNLCNRIYFKNSNEELDSRDICISSVGRISNLN